MLLTPILMDRGGRLTARRPGGRTIVVLWRTRGWNIDPMDREGRICMLTAALVALCLKTELIPSSPTNHPGEPDCDPEPQLVLERNSKLVPRFLPFGLLQ